MKVKLVTEHGEVAITDDVKFTPDVLDHLVNRAVTAAVALERMLASDADAATEEER